MKQVIEKKTPQSMSAVETFSGETNRPTTRPMNAAVPTFIRIFAKPKCMTLVQSRPVLKHRAQVAKGAEAPWEPGLPGFVR